MSSHSPILDATLRLIVRGGVHAIRYRDVAKECGVSLGTLSYHSPAREALLSAAFLHFLRESEIALRQVAERMPVSSAEDIGALVVEAMQIDFLDPNALYRVEYELLLYAIHDPMVANEFNAWNQLLINEIGQILASVGVPEPHTHAVTLLDITRGFQLATFASPGADLQSLKHRVTSVVAALIGSASASRSPPTPAAP